MYKLSKADRALIEQHRGIYLPDPHWYAVMTHWGRERRIHAMLLDEYGQDGLTEALLPELLEDGEGPKKRELLFGGYVFFRSRMNDETYINICSHPWIFKILGNAFRIPLVIEDAEMQLFRGVLETAPRPRLVTRSQIGRIALVSEGLMKGLQGRVLGVSAQFVKIEASFSFLDPGNCLVVSVPHEQVLINEEEPDGEGGRDLQMVLGS